MCAQLTRDLFAIAKFLVVVVTPFSELSLMGLAVDLVVVVTPFSELSLMGLAVDLVD